MTVDTTLDGALSSLQVSDTRSCVDGEAEAEGDAGQLTILYGSETGTAADVAYTISRTALRRRLRVTLASMDEYDAADLIYEERVLFVVATAGQGDFPASAEAFWRFLLRDGLPADVLADTRFAVFGLGDSSYPRFNWPARKLRRRLAALGASEILEHGEADDQHYLGVEGTLLPWLEAFWAALPMPDGVKAIPDDEMLDPSVRVQFLNHPEPEPEPEPAQPGEQVLEPGWQWATLETNDRMTHPSHWQDVRLLTLRPEPPSSPFHYAPGDVASLRPENAPADVARLLARLGWDSVADRPLRLSPSLASGSGLPLGRVTTLRTLLTRHLDPFSVPRRSFFDAIRLFTPPGTMEREKLDEFCQPGDGAEEMHEYAQRVRRTIAEVLYEFRDVSIPPDRVCDVFPTLRPRQFSIASKPHPHRIQLAVAIVEYRTRLRDPRRGVCTAWMARLPPGPSTRIPVRITRGTLTMPASPEAPIILVGPGTGVAPLRAIAHTHPGKCLAFLGCRYKDKDFLFRDEWEHPANDKTQVVLAASRDAEKVYVQDRIREYAAQVWDIIGRQGGYVYVCG